MGRQSPPPPGGRGDIRFRRLVFPQPIGIVRVDDRGLAHLLARFSNLELPGDLHLFALVGGDSNDRAVRPGSSPGRGTTPMNCVRRREIRVDRGDVRAEHAVGEHALRIAIDQRCDVRDPIGRHCPTAHGKVAFGDDGPLSGTGRSTNARMRPLVVCGSVDFKGNDKVNRPVIECRDANDHLMALWQTRNRESAFESAGGEDPGGIGTRKICPAGWQAVCQAFSADAVDDRIDGADPAGAIAHPDKSRRSPVTVWKAARAGCRRRGSA